MRIAPLALRDGDRETLMSLTRSSTVMAGAAQRARIVLLAADGVSNTALRICWIMRCRSFMCPVMRAASSGRSPHSRRLICIARPIANNCWTMSSQRSHSGPRPSSGRAAGRAV